jgi:hypothetical protein
MRAIWLPIAILVAMLAAQVILTLPARVPF